MIALIAATLIISGTVKEVPYKIVGNSITINKTTTLKTTVVGNNVVVKSTL